VLAGLAEEVLDPRLPVLALQLPELVVVHDRAADIKKVDRRPDRFLGNGEVLLLEGRMSTSSSVISRFSIVGLADILPIETQDTLHPLRPNR